MERSDRERRNGAAVKSEKAENRAVRDAVPEIYGSPDNEGGLISIGDGGATSTGLLCLLPAYSPCAKPYVILRRTGERRAASVQSI